jgi:uncharacterized lipoprotein NlpE involved in copper resistance
MPAAWFGVAVGAIGLLNSLSAADDADILRRESQAKQAKYNLAKMEIAANIQARADAIFGVWQSYYLPVELDTLNEICSEPEAIANKLVVAQRARAELAKIYAVAKKQQAYCLTPQQIGLRLESEVSLSIRQAETTAGVIRSAVRTEEARVRLVNAQNLTNRMNIINSGRQHNASSVAALAAASAEYDQLSKAQAQNIADASRAVGRGLAMAVTNGQEILKSAKNIGSTIQYQQPIQIEPYKDAFERQDLRREPINVTVNVDAPIAANSPEAGYDNFTENP